MWNDTLGTFDLSLHTTIGISKLKVLKVMARGAIFLIENDRFDLARVILDHPFWKPHTFSPKEPDQDEGRGWGSVVWGEGAAAIVLAFRRIEEAAAAQMLQDLWPLYTEAGGVLTVAQKDESLFPYGGVAATAFHLIAQSPRHNQLWFARYEPL